jgi:hypothetical protein
MYTANPPNVYTYSSTHLAAPIWQDETPQQHLSCRYTPLQDGIQIQPTLWQVYTFAE